MTAVRLRQWAQVEEQTVRSFDALAAAYAPGAADAVEPDPDLMDLGDLGEAVLTRRALRSLARATQTALIILADAASGPDDDAEDASAARAVLPWRSGSNGPTLRPSGQEECTCSNPSGESPVGPTEQKPETSMNLTPREIDKTYAATYDGTVATIEPAETLPVTQLFFLA
ncbi:hypothetical protein [Aeromicrobium yanjiei]|uniref:Uncharacterized protein n=1 Tax=Aeromicrobium yanjiei TaxID=2662028 RepID=A0A5Q2MK03_9ACTN|nr:hypothetical protein [Aeromicrobium yanjiei]QGG41386.1 hypothetical protein GEV26_08440 [Aeromicrobium yanjiei]